MRKLALFSVLLLATALMLASQEYKGKGRQSGYVYDEQGNPLEGVTVRLVYVKGEQGFEVKTDAKGRWLAAWIRGGAWNIDFEKDGYAPKKISVNIGEINKNPEITINLTKTEGPVLTDDVKEVLVQGNKLYEEGKYTEALAKFTEILEKHPDLYLVFQNLGACYFAQEKYDQAEANFLKVLEKDPRNVNAIIAVGNCYSNRGDAEKATEWYGKVEFEKIDDPIVLYNLGINYYSNNKFEDALKFFQKSFELQKDSTDTLFHLGLTYLNVQKNAESIASFEAYLKLDSESGRADQVRAFLEFLRKK